MMPLAGELKRRPAMPNLDLGLLKSILSYRSALALKLGEHVGHTVMLTGVVSHAKCTA